MQCVDEQIAETKAPAAGRVPSSVVSATERARADAQKMAEDRRAHRRVPGKMLEWMSVARVKYGPDVTIVDVSPGGALLQSDRPLAPGSRQALEIVGPDKSIVVPFGVLRSRLTALDSRGTTYRAACSFGRPLDLPEFTQPASDVVAAGPESTPEPEPPAASVPVSADPTPLPVERGTPADVPLPPGWQKIVARFSDGRTLKGYCADFEVTKPQFSLLPLPTPAASGRAAVNLADLKAVFFVREFSASRSTASARRSAARPRGARSRRL
jgi:hypothetical protein